jgi:hypothetical protein
LWRDGAFFLSFFSSLFTLFPLDICHHIRLPISVCLFPHLPSPRQFFFSFFPPFFLLFLT